MSKNKTVEFHLDIMGKEIRKGSFVFSNWWNGDMQVCVVDSLSPKMVKVRRVLASRNSYRAQKNKYPHELAVIENQEDVTMYILKNANSSHM